MAEPTTERVSTGVPGLDEILNGGLPAGQSFVVTGSPGTGKTTLALHFATACARAGKRVLFIALKEHVRQIRHNATTIGLDLGAVNFLDLSPSPQVFAQERPYDLFVPAEVEQAPMARAISDALNTLRPQRVIIDPINTFRYLSTEPYQFRRQVLALMNTVTQDGATLLAPVEVTEAEPEADLQFMADGIIEMLQTPVGRKLRVVKLAGSAFQGGEHTMALTGKGMQVFPRLVPSAHRRPFEYTPLPSGVRGLDEMLQGGLSRGMFTLISGPTGAGKTTLGLEFIKEAARRGERCVVYSFDEDPCAIQARAENVGVPIGALLERGALSLVKVEALQYSPDEFAYQVRQEVEQRRTQIVMVDGLDGYNLSIRMHGGDLTGHLHALAEYLDNMGVMGIMTADVSLITGPFSITDERVSYVADNVIFLRWLEMDGALHRVIGVLKKRLSGHETTLREFEITPTGIKLGAPLQGMRGILTGIAEAAGPERVGVLS